ncbi:MAG: tRNA(fMet)-specific endonuclease VapC [Cognaticolwellia sp.]|jgi:tRNA(fMet)-specific endonuclease VapC
MFHLDTNTLIYFFKGQGGVPARLLAHAPGQLAVSSLVVFELETGLAKSTQSEKRRGQLRSVLSMIQVIPFDQEEAQVSASLRARLEKVGRPIGPMDTLIAGTALCHGASLVTRNVSEFGRVEGLRVVDWYD